MRYTLIAKLLCCASLTLPAFAQTRIAVHDSEKIHASLDQEFAEYAMPRKVDDLVKTPLPVGTNTLLIKGPDLSQRHAPVVKSTIPRVNLESMVANASLVIEGIPQKARTSLCAAGTFICSTYEVLVTRVVRANGVGVLAGQSVVVARGGGDLTYHGVNIRAVDPNFAPFKLDEPYVFFLNLLPDTGAFRTSAAFSFLLEGGKAFDGRTKGGMEPTDRATFLREVEHASHIEIREVR